VVGRTAKRADTWNASANQFNYPQTPARVQLSIWPGGADTNQQGTIDWAGGPIDWNGQDIQNNGYYYVTVGEIEIKCYNAPNAPGTNKGVSYTFNDARALEQNVVDGSKPTVLKSFAGTGLDMNAGDSGSSNNTAQIPGGTSSGPGANPGGASGSSSGGAASACDATRFSQSNCNADGSKSDGARPQERSLGASAFAVVIAVACLLWM
jgi:hypothetical protein